MTLYGNRTVTTATMNVRGKQTAIEVKFDRHQVKDGLKQIAGAFDNFVDMPYISQFVSSHGMNQPRAAFVLVDRTDSVASWSNLTDKDQARIDATTKLNELAAGMVQVFVGTVGDDETVILPSSFTFPHSAPRSRDMFVRNTIAGIRGMTPMMPLLDQETGELSTELTAQNLPTLTLEGGTNLNDALWALGHVIKDWFDAMDAAEITPETVEVLIGTDGFDVRSLADNGDLDDLYKDLRKRGGIRITILGFETGRNTRKQAEGKLKKLAKSVGGQFYWAGQDLQAILQFARMSQMDPEGFDAAVAQQETEGDGYYETEFTGGGYPTEFLGRGSLPAAYPTSTFPVLSERALPEVEGTINEDPEA